MNIPAYGNTFRKWGVFHQLLKVSANTPPNLTVRVNEGSAFVNGVFTEYAGGSITLSVATAGTQIALIGLRGTQLVAIYSEAAVRDNPILPSNLPIDFLPLAAVVITEGTTAIYDDQIQDLRPLFSINNPIKSHKDLENLNDTDAHPMEAITGLQDALDTKLTMQDVDDRLKDIVSGDGTSRKIFTINKNAVGINSSNLVLEFRRGTQISAGIRWNENYDQMEYTDSEGNWIPMDPTRTSDGASTRTSVYSTDEIDQKNREILAVLRAEIEDVQEGIPAAISTAFARELEPQINSITNTVDNKIAEATVQFEEIQTNTDTAIQNRLAIVDEKIDQAAQNIQQVSAETIAKIAQNNADSLASYTTIANNLEVKFNTINDKHEQLNTTVEECTTQFNTLQTNTESAISEQNEKITTIEENITSLQENKANKDDVYAKDETYTTDEVDNNIDSSISAALSSINAALKETAGQDDTTGGNADPTITDVINQTKQLILDTKTKISTEYTEAISTANEQVLAQAETNILEKAGIESFDKFASVESVEALTNTLNTKVDEINATISANTDSTESSVLSLTSAIDNVATKAEEDLQAAVETINAALDTKANKETTYTKTDTDQLLDEIKNNTYTKTEANEVFNTKADKTTVESQIENLMNTKQDKYIYIPENTANKNMANGYAGLDANGKLALSLLPDAAKQATHIISNATERLDLTDLLSGEKAYEIETGNSYIYDGTQWILTAAANWENINLDFNNIINKPNTINSYGITDAYTKAQVDNVIESNLTTATNAINDNINATKTALESSIASSDTALNSKITTINNSIDTINNSITTINGNIDTINIGITTINGNITDINNTKANKAETYTKSDVNNLLNDKTDKTTSDAIDTKVDDLEASTNTKFNEVNESLEALDTNINTVDAKFANYATNSTVNDINADLNDRIDNNETAIDNINTNLADYAKSADVTNDINNAVDDIYSTLDNYALKTYVNDEIDSAINDALAQINSALQDAVDDDSTHGDEVDLSNTIKSTVNLITDLNESTNTKITTLETTTNTKFEEVNDTIDTKVEEVKETVIQTVKETVIKEVITQEVGTTDLSDLASKDYVDGEIATINNTITEQVNAINNTIITKETTLNDSITALNNNKQDVLTFVPEDIANKNIANGYAGLDANGKISVTLLPDTAKQPTYIVADEAARLTLTGLISGVKAFETSTKNSYIYDGSKWILVAAANWENINLDFNNIINKPTTINGYGITDAYTKAQVTNAISTSAEAINSNIDDTTTVLENKISAGDAALNSKITTINSNIELINTNITSIEDSITEVNNQIEVANTNISKKANANDVYTKSQVNTAINTINDNIDAVEDRVEALESSIITKANANDVYAKTVADTTFATKAELTITNGNITTLSNSTDDAIEAVNNRVNTVEDEIETINGLISTVNTNIGTKTDISAFNEAIEEINTTLDTKANKTEVYTKTNVDSLLSIKEIAINAVSDRVATLESAITTKANKSEVYTKTSADSTFATKTTIADIDERVVALETEIVNKANVDDVYTKIDAGNAFAEKATVNTIAEDIEEINEKIEALAATEYVDTELSKKVDITDIFDNDHLFHTRYQTSGGNVVTIFNESDGGGAQCYVKNSDIRAFAGVNTDEQNIDGNNIDQAINVQLYAKYNGTTVGTANYGSRINVNVHGAYYTVGTDKANSAAREIAVKGDVNALADLITALTTRIEELEAKVEALENA